MNDRTSMRAFAEKLGTEQLLDLLQADYESPEGADEDLTVCIMEVIAERNEETGDPSGSDKAWEDFQNYFNTMDGGSRSLYPTEELPESEPAVTRRRPIKRLLTAAAIAVLILILGMAAAQALGYDVFGVIARWTDETFHFTAITEPEREIADPENEAIRIAVQDALDECGITAVPVPTWYPEGSTLTESVRILDNKTSIGLRCSITCDDRYVTITAQRYNNENQDIPYMFEKDLSQVEEYISGSRKFYVISNMNNTSATWSDGQSVLKMSGNVSLETIRHILDSIGD